MWAPGRAVGELAPQPLTPRWPQHQPGADKSGSQSGQWAGRSQASVGLPMARTTAGTQTFLSDILKYLKYGFYCQTEVEATQGSLKTIVQCIILERGRSHLVNVSPFRQLKGIPPFNDINVEQAQKTIQTMWRGREKPPVLLLRLKHGPAAWAAQGLPSLSVCRDSCYTMRWSPDFSTEMPLKSTSSQFMGSILEKRLSSK